jgi:epoxyqueuosine reductase
MVPLEDGAACDDRDACTQDEFCTAGACGGGINACFCRDQADGTACNDGQRCTANDQCVGGACLGTPINCAQLDAGRCISYLTIEHRGPIPEPLRAPMGNRVFGCDDCQLVCPWNKFAQSTREDDFHPRHQLEASDLVELFLWSEPTFLKRTEGSAIRRTGYAGWLRNLAVALGNAPPSARIIAALEARQEGVDAMVREHIVWALKRQRAAAGA